MKRILHVIDALEKGGSEMVAVNLATKTSEEYEMHLCATRAEGPLKTRVELSTYLFAGRKTFWDRKAMHKLNAYIEQQNIDLIHAHGSAVYFCMLARLFKKKIPLVYTDHYGLRLEKRRRLPLQIIKKQVDKVVCVSYHLENFWKKKMHLLQDKLAVVQNGVKEVEGERERVKGRIVCCANFRPQKDHKTLIKAVKIAIEKGMEGEVLLVGSVVDKTYFNEVVEMIKAYDLESTISIKGFAQHPEEVMLTAEIGILSSESEGLPLALLEYIQCGLATIVTDVGDCKNIVDRIGSGWVVPPKDPQALADAISSCLKKGAPYRKNAREKKDQVSLSTMIQKMKSVYAEVLRS